MAFAFEEIILPEVDQSKITVIDGPAGCGKTSEGEELARRLGGISIDTGKFFRAAAYAVLREGTFNVTTQDISLEEMQQRAALVQALHITTDFSEIDGRTVQEMRIGGIRITDLLETSEIERAVPYVARHEPVRMAVASQYMRLMAGKPSVVVGRDGWKMFPGAKLFYMDIDPRIAAERRARQRLAQIEADLARRDQLDRHVMSAPGVSFEAEVDRLLCEMEARNQRDQANGTLRIVDSAIVIQNNGTFEQAFEQLWMHCRPDARYVQQAVLAHLAA